jgi:parallel beta-helix repeat protein
MKTKIIGILICMLLITSAAVPIVGHVLKNFNYESIGDRGTIYVDDDGGADYTKIQDAVDNATSGDTIYVYAGTYNENIVVSITINLVGEDKDTTIIHGVDETDDALEINSNWCNISEFTIENGGSNSGGIRVKADHCSIFDSIFDDNIDRGIFVESSEYTEISDSTFSENNQGLYIYMSDYTTISSNVVSDNKDNGILCLTSDYNDILGNTVQSNSGVGVYLNNQCDYNEIIGNSVSSNEEGGIRLYQSDENAISGNTVSNNGDIGEDGGIVCFYSNNNDIFENTVNSNYEQGIFIELSNSNMVYENDIYDNDMYGINCDSSISNEIYNNNIYDNTQNGIDDGTNTWYSSSLSQGNYWDDYTGEDNNWDGIGDSPYDVPGDSNQDEYPLMTPYGPPKADFSYSVDDKNVTFDGSRSYDYDGTIVSYEWDFDDGDTGSGLTIVHTYDDDGDYDVELEITDDDGKTDSTVISVLVDSTPPEVEDNTPDTATTGDLFTFNATITDNVEVGSATVNYKYGEGDFNNLDMVNTEDDYW